LTAATVPAELRNSRFYPARNTKSTAAVEQQSEEQREREQPHADDVAGEPEGSKQNAQQRPHRIGATEGFVRPMGSVQSTVNARAVPAPLSWQHLSAGCRTQHVRL
jgi:hypothetical protein